MSLVVLLASSLAVVCASVPDHHMVVAASVDDRQTQTQDNAGHEHSQRHLSHSAQVLHGYADAVDHPATASHGCFCDFACHNGWAFTEAHIDLGGMSYAHLMFDWSSEALVGALSSTLDRPPKSLVRA
jgi:hypothetical protein